VRGGSRVGWSAGEAALLIGSRTYQKLKLSLVSTITGGVDIAGRTAVVTGGGGGIGAAIAGRLARAGAHVLIADLDADAARAAADRIGAAPGRVLAIGADVSDSEQIAALIERAEGELGPLTFYVANAGVGGPVGLGVDEAAWDQAFEVNIRAHVRAARLLVPRWLERGEGYFLSTASAAGLLTQLGSAAYSVTKHAAVGFAEWLAVTYGDRGIRVSCLCPMGVDTPMLHAGTDSGDPDGAMATAAVTSAGDVLQPDDVAAVVLDAIADERFLILPHPDVARMYRNRATDTDRWLIGMRRYQASLHA
jgi:NAD(P)-dependent dehydrogenase (short-subunit alcohol dehydrogenase family)